MHRKLTVILSADVVGYSGLMERDEEGTLALLKANRVEVFDPAVAKYGGRQFKLMGDGALVEFGSVVAAITCALAIQEQTDKEESLRYRIGINLGEVIIEGDDIYGEGVNIAARIQALAPVGGVALSRLVKDQADGKMPCVFEDMGEHSVKNIERPVHVYKVSNTQAKDRDVEAPRKLSICVLPFANMSDDPQQEYFSDGISEDIITDLSKVSALFVVSRNTAFQYKGKSVDVPQVARQVKVNYVLEGSVRKAGGRVRITAQLIDGITGGHIWADRHDRDLNDIFALQDEISEAIVNALKLKLLPEERKAIEARGTDSVDAYNLYLMARQYNIGGNLGDSLREEAIVRLCKRATEIDPGYARAWALMALAQNRQRHYHASAGDGGMVSAERALALDSNLAEAHAVKALILSDNGREEEASAALAAALALDPESYQVNELAGSLSYKRRRMDDAIRYYEKATPLMETDFYTPGMLRSCYAAIGNTEGCRRAAQISLSRAEKALAQDQSNGGAMAFCANALVALGQLQRAKQMMARALLINPENTSMRYNFACAAVRDFKETDSALELIAPFFASATIEHLNHAKIDISLDPLREDPRFKAMIAAAEVRLAQAAGSKDR